MGKMHREPFPASSRKPEDLDILEISCMDLSGKLPVSSLGGSNYWMIIKDKRDGYRDIYFLKRKSDAADIIIQHDRRMVRKDSSRTYRVQIYQSDNGGEFMTSKLRQYFKDNGIKHETIVPYEHEQAGSVEVENRVLFAKAESMRFTSGLPKEFWAESIATATYCANRSPSSSRGFKTPYELRFGHVPNLHHMRIFGCRAMAHIAPEKRKLLDYHAVECIFMGYADSQKGYRLYNPKTKQFFVSRNIICDEKAFPAQKQDDFVSMSDDSLPQISVFPLHESLSQSQPQISEHPCQESDVPQPPSSENHSQQSHVPQLTSSDDQSDLTADQQQEEVLPPPIARPVPKLHESNPSSNQLPELSASRSHRPQRSHRPPGEWWKINCCQHLPISNVALASRPLSADSSELNKIPRPISLDSTSVLNCYVELSAPVPKNGIDLDMKFLDDAIAASCLDRERRLKANLPVYDVTTSCNAVTSGTTPIIPSDLKASSIPVPTSLRRALEDPDWGQHWRLAAGKEMSAIRSRSTWFLCTLPDGRKAIDCKWVFTVKPKADGTIDKFKARLVVRGFSQQPGVDYNDTFAPVAAFETQRILLALAAQHGLRLRQADVIGAFLHSEIDVELYMKQPEGFIDPDFPEHVCNLQKGLYGLKQAGNLFNKKLNAFVVDKLGFTRTNADPCLYFRYYGDKLVLLSLHVDDMQFAHDKSLDSEMNCIMSLLHAEFGIEDMGLPSKLLGVRITVDEETGDILLDQESYVDELLTRFNMTHCKAVNTPHQPNVYLSDTMCPSSDSEREEMVLIPYDELVGGLNFLATRTRPDIAYITSQLCRFMRNPGHDHWTAAKRVLRYLKTTKTFGIRYHGDQELHGFTDSDWAGDPDHRRSVTGNVFMFANGPIAWKCFRQKSTALSALEAEYMAQCDAARMAAWLSGLFAELRMAGPAITIYGDNQGAQSLANNRKSDSRTKHIDVRYHFTRDKVEDKTIALQYCPTESNLADYLTKPINVAKFQWCRNAIGMTDVRLRGCVRAA
jgi:hypothetical protein